DYALCYRGNAILFIKDKKSKTLRIPSYRELKKDFPDTYNDMYKSSIYLCAVDKEEFFILNKEEFPFDYEDEEKGYSFEESISFRTFSPSYMAFVGVTGNHVYKWLKSRVYCGCCGTKNKLSERERAMVCPKCKNTEYPKISPAIIVAVRDKDKLLLVKPLNSTYKFYALVAGFIEIGETAEDAVRRECMEEVGIKIKNILPYKSQPWGFSGSLMLGFTADLDGSSELKLQEEEIGEAVWFERSEVPVPPGDISVGQEMIRSFKEGII
ncbi:MAG: NAD(+) diphosphatase, partial [Lachnoanaerobaculum gingivalis]